MSRNWMGKAATVLIGLAGAIVPTAAAFSQTITLKSGQSADLFPVYWIENCVSQLDHFAGVEIVSGPPGLKLSLRQQDVKAVRQNCSALVPGAIVVVTAPEVSQPSSGTLKYKVRYVLKNGGGNRDSEHSRQIALVP